MKQEREQKVWHIRYAGQGKKYERKGLERAAVIIVASGSMEVSIGGNSFHTGMGGMFLLPPMAEAAYRILENTQLLVCSFTPETILPLLTLPPVECATQTDRLQKGVPVLKSNYVISLFLGLMEHYLKMDVEAAGLYEIKRQEFFCLLAGSYRRDVLTEFLAPVSNHQDRFKAFMQQNWMKARNVEELATLVNLSPSGFMKKFRRYFNEPPYQWIQKQKAICVLRDIVVGEIPLKVIADKYYFASYAHFGSFCKSQYGATPKELSLGKGREIMAKGDSD